MRGNIGEWSELYAFFKLLADGRLYAADAETNRIDNIYYDILKIIRNQTDGKWEYIRNGNVKVIMGESKEPLLTIPIEHFKNQSDILLSRLKNEQSRNGAFEIPEVWSFASKIKCSTLKARSVDKSDIILMLHDIHSGRDDTFGFSIKSQLGSASTLLNPSTATNFIYNIINHRLTDSEIDRFNGLKYYKDKFDYLDSIGAAIQFNNMESNIFKYNLMLVETQLPRIIANMLESFYRGKGSKVKELTRIVAQDNLLSITEGNAEEFYAYKIKELLTDIALGMVPSTIWTGSYDATGGYIIVKEDGDVLCYHIYNRNEFRDYLFINTKFDTPSKSRYGFGNIEKLTNGLQQLKLNLQIRFIK